MTVYLLAITPLFAESSPAFTPYLIPYDSKRKAIFRGNFRHSFKPDYVFGVGLTGCLLFCCDDSPEPTPELFDFCLRVGRSHSPVFNEIIRQ